MSNNKEFDEWLNGIALRYPIISTEEFIFKLKKFARHYQQEAIEQKNKEIELHFDFIVDNNLESKFNHWVNEQALSEVDGER